MVAIIILWNLVHNFPLYNVIETFNSTSRYMHDFLILTILISKVWFEYKIYPLELQLKKANNSDAESSF